MENEMDLERNMERKLRRVTENRNGKMKVEAKGKGDGKGGKAKGKGGGQYSYSKGKGSSWNQGYNSSWSKGANKGGGKGKGKSTFDGWCNTFGQYGHRVRECLVQDRIMQAKRAAHCSCCRSLSVCV